MTLDEPHIVAGGRVVTEPRARLAERTRREVAQAWQGEQESAVDELIDERRVEAQREAAE